MAAVNYREVFGDKTASQPERATTAQIPAEYARLRDNVQELSKAVEGLLAQISVVMLPTEPMSVNEASKEKGVGGCILAMDLASITEQVQYIRAAIHDAQKRIQL